MPALIYDTSITSRERLGKEYTTPTSTDRVFRYAKNGPTALAVGTVLQGPRPNDSHANMTVNSAAAVGATSVTVILDRGDPMALDEYKEGYLYINDQGVTLVNAGGAGFLYDVLTHPGGDAGEDTTKKITLREPIVVALTTSSQATLIPNPYSGVTKPDLKPQDVIVGVAPVAVPANQFFWIQVRGPAVVLQSGRLWAGLGVMLSQKHPGAVEVLKQVVPIEGGLHPPPRTGDAYTTGDAARPSSQFQQYGIEQRLQGDTQRTEDEEILTELSGKATIPIRPLGYCINPRVSTEHALVYLTLS